jgi:hypothetical protein
MVTGVDGGNGERLDSWKAIATYLGRDAGTVRRWERTRGLPVHRVPGGKGSSVFAYKNEIDLWLKSASEEPLDEQTAEAEPATPGRGGWRWAVALAAVVVLVLAWQVQQPRASAADMQIHMDERAVTASAGDGRELWVRRLEVGFRHIKSGVGEATRVVAGRSSRIYYLVSQRIGRTDNVGEGGEFTALEADGRARFTFRFFDDLLFAGNYFSAPWALTSFSLLDGDPPQRIAVAAHHWVWSPSLIAILDDNGKRLGTFAHYGWIEQLQWWSPDRLVFGGFSDARNGGMVGVLDPRQLDGQGPEPVGSPYFCENCGRNQPLRMAVMPRSEVNLLTQSRFNRAILERIGDRLTVRTIEVPAVDGQGAADAIYEFTASLDLISASYSNRYWEIHDRLEREGKVDHDRDHCPSRNGPQEIQVWARETGWKTLPVEHRRIANRSS